MDPKHFLSIMEKAEKLKCNTRHSWTSNGRQESVADHSWRLAFMALMVRDEFTELDMDKVIRMCLIHDLGEAITGDIPTFDKTKQDEVLEDEVLHDWIATFPETYKQEFVTLFEEMNALETGEAKLYKALDNLEAVIQHNSADLSTWLPLEYELQFTYGKDKVAFSEYLKRLAAEIDCQTRKKIDSK
ncbi:HD domain-containing protein [Anaerosporobacter faecicola]|uniref:HD domain-containing protein n=1 Tax=Anaerosporobacter faecicola TaxID=2718714 RepID=UPI001439BF8A|nr:HD domain-containing protein [Anaerosporobacter faecicola]